MVKRLLLLLLLFQFLLVPVAADPPSPFEGATAGEIECQLIGDGSRTNRTQVQFRNLTDEGKTFTLKEYTKFEAEGRQTLIVLQEKTITLAPRKAARSTITTMCAGIRSDTPATTEPTVYQPSVDPALAGQVRAIFEKAEKAEEGGYFPALPIPPALQVTTVAQLAFWQQTGQLTKETLKPEILKQLGLDPEQITSEQEKEVDQGLDNIWEAVDLCKK